MPEVSNADLLKLINDGLKAVNARVDKIVGTSGNNAPWMPSVPVTPAAPTNYDPFPDGPRAVKVGNAVVMLAAPVNPLYVGDSLYTPTFGGGYEPSNAPAGFPMRSANGFPLFYPLAAGGQPAGSPWVMYDGRTFPDERALLAYRQALAQGQNIVPNTGWGEVYARMGGQTPPAGSDTTV